MPATKVWTADEVRAMQDDGRAWPRFELVDGVLLVTPAPSWDHQEAVVQLLESLGAYLTRERVGRVVLSPADIELDPGTVLHPDVFVVPAGDVRPHGSWRDVKSLLLAIEVLSPATGRHDRVVKRRFYQRMDVPEYWIVDTGSRVIERWRPRDERPEVLDSAISWHPVGATGALVIGLEAFFARVHREAP